MKTIGFHLRSPGYRHTLDPYEFGSSGVFHIKTESYRFLYSLHQHIKGFGLCMASS